MAPIKSLYITRLSTRLCTDARRVEQIPLLTHFPSFFSQDESFPEKLRNDFLSTMRRRMQFFGVFKLLGLERKNLMEEFH